MKNILIFVLSALFSIQGFSQKNFARKDGGASGAANSNYDLFSRTIDINQKDMSFGLTKAEFDAIKDDAYLNIKFIPGNIYQDENLLKSNVLMRYNAYADEIEITENVQKKSKYGALMKDPSIYVKIANDIFVFIPYNDSNEKGGYFNIIADGKNYDLYKKTTSVFKEPRKAKSSYDSDTPPSFEKTTKYYLVENGVFFELPKSRSRILKAMDLKKNEVKKYVKENNLDVFKEADLIKVFTYYDSLL